MNPFFSADSRFLFLQSFANDLTGEDSDSYTLDLYQYELSSGALSRLNQKPLNNGSSEDWISPVFSTNLDSLVFVSRSLGLVSNKFTASVTDVFKKDLRTGAFRLLSVSTNGQVGGDLDSRRPVMSSDGGVVAFESIARNLAPVRNFFSADKLFTSVYVYEEGKEGLTLVNPARRGTQLFGNAFAPSLSGDGKRLAFVGDDASVQSKVVSRVFVRDNLSGGLLWTGTNFEITASQLTPYLVPELSQDGRWVGFVRPGVQGTPNRTPVLIMHDLDENKDYVLETNLLSSLPVTHARESGRVLFERAGQFGIWDPVRSLLDYITVPGGDALTGTGVTALVFPDAHLKKVTYRGRVYRDGTNYNHNYPQAFVLDRETGNEELVSGTPDGLPGKQLDLSDPVISPDGRWVAFQASDSDIVEGDRNRCMDVFLRDLTSRKTTLVSRRLAALERATTHALTYGKPSISQDGRLLAFSASDGEMVEGDTNRSVDVFLLDTSNGDRRRVNSFIDPQVQELRRHLLPWLSGNARSLAFLALYQLAGSPQALPTRLYHYDVETGDQRLVSSSIRKRTDDFTLHRSPPLFALSGDGRWIAYESVAVPGIQIVVEDLVAKTNLTVSLNTNDQVLAYTSTTPWLSSNGTRVLFLSDGAGFAAEPLKQLTDVKRLYVRDLVGGATRALSHRADEDANLSKADSIEAYIVSPNQALAAFRPGPLGPDVSGAAWIADLTTFTNREFPQVQAIFGLSHDGRYAVARHHPLTPTGNRGLCRMETGTGDIIPFEAGSTWGAQFRSTQPPPLISADGRFIVFESEAGDLVSSANPRQTDIFLRDVEAGVTILLSANRQGTGPGNGPSSSPMLAPDGRTLWFSSWASDLVSGDYNASRDFFQVQLSAGDSDQDGLADDWEYAYFNTLSHNGAEDSDGDGRSDAQEYRAGTSPVSGESVLRVFTLRRSGDAGVQVLWAAVPGKTYAIQRRDSLVDAAWQDVGSVRALTSTADWTEVDPSSPGQRFYRVFVVE